MTTEETTIGELLAEQLERLFSREVDRERIVAVEQGRFDRALWDALEEIGVRLALAPEEAGGVGLTWEEAEPALRTAGEWAAPVPLGETMIAAWALGRAGLEIPDGPVALAEEIMALDEDGRVSGSASLVPWLSQCDYLLVVARQNQSTHLCLMDRQSLELSAVDTLARIPSSRVQCHKATPIDFAEIGDLVGELGLLPHIATLRTVQMAGLLDRLLSLCVEYGNDREQFGRPIGKFQAVQHMIAEMASQAAAARVAGLYACRQVDRKRAIQGATVAKARTGPAATRGAEAAHQVFGAIGFTDEHILHYYSRRLWQWRSEGGSENWWAERLGREVLAAGGEKLWPHITAPATADGEDS